jgi:hypothetical protein
MTEITVCGKYSDNAWGLVKLLTERDIEGGEFVTAIHIIPRDSLTIRIETGHPEGSLAEAQRKQHESESPWPPRLFENPMLNS